MWFWCGTFIIITNFLVCPAWNGRAALYDFCCYKGPLINISHFLICYFSLGRPECSIWVKFKNHGNFYKEYDFFFVMSISKKVAFCENIIIMN